MGNQHHSAFGKFAGIVKPHCDDRGYLIDTHESAYAHLMSGYAESNQAASDWAHREASVRARKAIEARQLAARKLEEWRAR